jgi:hypothetical protein
VSILGWIACRLGFHDMHSWAEDHGFGPPPAGHVCRRRLADTDTSIRIRFVEWTALRCRRCAWRFPR